ncbi:hypothetical protein ACH419_41330 [Streptomyces bobili]|uniref:hypothetical protein n=1 Tax=Streptomyces bobili TaxID=67280 RepID=UPI0037A807AA
MRALLVRWCGRVGRLPGVPQDFQPIRHLFEQFDSATFSYFRPLYSTAVVRHRPEHRPPLEVVGYVVSHSELHLPDFDDAPAEWVIGFVARNPHRGEAWPPSDEWPGRVEERELIIPSLRSHHQLHELKKA